MSRFLAGCAGALVGMLVGMGLLIIIDRLILHPGTPDAGQLGQIGMFIGIPVGFAVGWSLAKR